MFLLWLMRIIYFLFCFIFSLIICFSLKRYLKENKNDKSPTYLFMAFYILNSLISNYILEIKGIITLIISCFFLLFSYFITKKIRIFGLTGQIASGKTTMSKYLTEKYQAVIIDIDKVNAEVLKEKEVINKIKSTFGEGVFDEFGNLNKLEIRKIIYSDKEKKRQLEKITHFRVFMKLFYKILQVKLSNWKTILIIENAILLQIPILKYICYLIIAVVSNNMSMKIRRIMDRDGISDRVLAESIVNSQMSIQEFKEKADIVIENDGDLDDLYVTGDKLAEILMLS
jgi:dephospho-CoA kinase